MFKLVLLVARLSLSIYLSVVNYSNWQENLTITTLKVIQKYLYLDKISNIQDAAKPVSELPFPSVTICSPGLNMEAVKEALLDDFNNWLNVEGKAEGNYEDLMDEFMEEKYATKVAEGNIFDQIKEMNSPPSTENQDCEGCSATLQNLAACKEANNGRKKRSLEGKSVKIFPAL